MQQPSSDKPRIQRHVTCPFCGLLCDDLSIETDGRALRAIENACERARAGFERDPGDAGPRVEGEAATVKQAVAAARRYLKGADLPLLCGLGTDVAGMRAALALAERYGGIVDHLHGEALARNTHTLQDGGWINTTLTEVKNRADLIVFAGTDGVSEHPRLFERFVWPRATLLTGGTGARAVVYIGRGLDTGPGTAPDGTAPSTLPCEPRRIGEVLAALRALVHGYPLKAERIGGIPARELAALAERMQGARYGVLAWSAAAFDFPHAELCVQNACELVKDLNRTTRFAGLPLGGHDGGTTAVNVCTWSTGFPLRTGFASGAPMFGDRRFATGALLERGEADALVWISSFTPDHGPPEASVPRIVLAHPQTSLASEPEIFIPVATPGLDHRGQLFRCDSVVALPLKGLRGTGLPSAAAVLDAIADTR